MPVPLSAVTRRLGLAAILLLAAVALRWNYAHQGGGFLSDDGYQYMDAATNFANGQCLCTNLAHFDEQIAQGRFPVPLTHFAPGYPLLIALLMRLGALPVESAALLASALGYFLAIVLLWALARTLGADRVMAAGACLLWIVHSSALFYASATSTEPLFTALLLLAAWGIAVDLRNEGRKPQVLVLIGAAAALSYWIRYPGLFLIPVAGLYLVWRAWRSRLIIWPAAAIGSMLSLTAAVMLRNMVLAGSWRGGFAAMHSHETLRSALVGSLKAVFHIVFGERTPARLDAWAILFLIAAALLTWTVLRDRPKVTMSDRSAFAWLSLLAGLYIGGVLAASMQTIAGAFGRYYLPLYPLALAVAAALVSRIPDSFRKNLALAGMATAILAIQGRSLIAQNPVQGHHAVRDALLSETPNLRDWIIHNTEPEDVLFAVNGQALQYVLGRPVVSIPAPEFTNRKDDAGGIRTLMDRFNARYLILFPGMGPGQVPEQYSNPFLRELAAGGTPPEWLAPAVRTRSGNVLILARVRQPIKSF